MGVFDQSIDRMRAPMSLPPVRQSQPVADIDVAGFFTSQVFFCAIQTISQRAAVCEAIMRKLKTLID
jgi:hypothetical protein